MKHFWKINNIADDLVDGLAQNDLDDYTHLLTGYIGSASFLKRVVLLVKTLKRKNLNLIYGMTCLEWSLTIFFLLIFRG